MKKMHFPQKDIRETKNHLEMFRRLRRNRSKAAWRNLIQENSLTKDHLVYPMFITELDTAPIESMPGIFRHSLSDALFHIKDVLQTGVQAINIFCHISDTKKDAFGSEALQKDSIFAKSIREIKKHFPEVLLTVDIALDPYTDHGLDGIIDATGQVCNDTSVSVLTEMALIAADCGADLIAPSDMMDGRVRHMRTSLDREGFTHVGILSYAVKFASHLYAPFRQALDSAPKRGDKKTFQVNPANGREALLECILDEQEGADLLLIKPGLPSLDIIALLRERTLLPIGAYQVSGEYSMIHAAADRGWINKEEVMLESLLCLRRAGADFIFTYAAPEIARILS
jgi:porphobilinogen synthase